MSQTKKPEMCSIRSATLQDHAVITEFNRFIASETEHLNLDPSVVQKGVQAILNDPSKGLYFVAETDGEVVGQVMITYEWSDWRNGNIWWLQSVYVRHDSRGKGVFKRLFNHVQELAKRDPRVCGIRLYVHHENASARRAYEKLGFDATAYRIFELAL